MEKAEFIRVRVTREEKASLGLKAAKAGVSLSEHLRSLMQADLSQPGPADEIAITQFELIVQTALMMTKMVDKILEPDEAKMVRETAKERAGQLVDETVKRLRSQRKA